MAKLKTRVITDESQVPDGFERIAVITDSRTKQKQLSDAHIAGSLAAVKLMRSTDDFAGPVWVNVEQANSIISGRADSAQKNGDGLAVSSWAIPEELVRLLERLSEACERIAASAESMATQPTNGVE